MSWLCQFVSGKGERCQEQAWHRLFFRASDPFTFIDLCPKHVEYYQHFLYRLDIPASWREEPKADEKRT